MASNLLSNAVKFTPPGGTVQVRLYCAAASIKFIVADTGEGIDPSFLPHVFDRFRQGNSTTTRKHGGLGLGLAIVHHILELHGGTIHAESPGKGKGATFVVDLPIPTRADSKQPALSRRRS
jgi:signal transduction histidine kinase